MFFFFNDTATTEIYTLSLHDALPISTRSRTSAIRRTAGSTRGPLTCPSSPPAGVRRVCCTAGPVQNGQVPCVRDRKSTRLNSSHANISYAVFCLKKKKKIIVYATFYS